MLSARGVARGIDQPVEFGDFLITAGDQKETWEKIELRALGYDDSLERLF